MRPVSGDFRPSAEVDEVRWLPVDAAVEVLTYERDRPVVQALVERTPG